MSEVFIPTASGDGSETNEQVITDTAEGDETVEPKAELDTGRKDRQTDLTITSFSVPEFKA